MPASVSYLNWHDNLMSANDPFSSLSSSRVAGHPHTYFSIARLGLPQCTMPRTGYCDAQPLPDITFPRSYM